MCGIVGYLRLQPDRSDPLAQGIAERMLATLWRRGPDGEGQWRSQDGVCWLGHRRLAVIDLETGTQPMTNEDGTLWTVFNGEIYNYKSLRSQLAARGHAFRTSSDTEVLLHGYEEWGSEELVKRLQGIFAFAIYDSKRRSIYLARDHMGVKPLYWWSDGNILLFASEIKALLAHPSLARREVNPSGVTQFLVSRYVSRPQTMFRNIFRLPEGTWMKVECGQRKAPVFNRYWDVQYREKLSLSLDEAVDELDRILTETVRMQLVADVPVGVQLSGGVDSSVVVALMSKIRKENGEKDPIKTFSVGFDVEKFSELPYAKMVADRYGTEHREIVVGFDDFARELPLLSWLYDEPLGEPPAIPTYFMCKRAKQEVTVMLCGEGADEQFGGYLKYVFEELTRLIDWMPGKIRGRLLRGAAEVLPFRARRIRAILENLSVGNRAARLPAWYGALDEETQRTLLDGQFLSQAGKHGLTDTFNEILRSCDSEDTVEQFMYCDIHSRLVDHLLVKGDRMSMAASVEARVPFLDARVVEYAAALPRRYKVNGMHTKIVLKKLAERYAPMELIYRRKVGFNVPLSQWFVGPLRHLVQKVLLSEQCLSRGYWQPDAVKDLVNGHLDGRVDREQGIWVLLSLELWHRLFVDADGSEKAVDQLRELVDSTLPTHAPRR